MGQVKTQSTPSDQWSRRFDLPLCPFFVQLQQLDGIFLDNKRPYFIPD